MPSEFDILAGDIIAPSLMGVHAETKGVIFRGLGQSDGDLVVDAIVDRLRSQREESLEKVVTRERVTIQVEASQFPPNCLPLLDTQKVVVQKYPGADFNVVVDETEYDNALIRITLARKPVDRFRDKRKRAS